MRASVVVKCSETPSSDPSYSSVASPGCRAPVPSSSPDFYLFKSRTVVTEENPVGTLGSAGKPSNRSMSAEQLVSLDPNGSGDHSLLRRTD